MEEKEKTKTILKLTVPLHRGKLLQMDYAGSSMPLSRKKVKVESDGWRILLD